MNVIRASLNDLPKLVPLFDAYRQFYKQASNLTACEAFLASRMSQQESCIFLALEAEQAIGFTQLYPSFSSVRMRRLWVLNDLFVHPDLRRKGVGRALLERAAEWGHETEAAALMLETGIDNLPAQTLYERLGWTRNDDYYVYYLSV